MKALLYLTWLLERPSGGLMVAMAMLDTLIRRGDSVTLCIPQQTTASGGDVVNVAQKFFGMEFEEDAASKIKVRKVGWGFRLYDLYMMHSKIADIVRKEEADLVIGQDELLSSLTRLKVKKLLYVNFPIVTILMKRLEELDEAKTSRVGKIINRIKTSIGERIFTLQGVDFVVCNSTITAGFLKEACSLEPIIVHPPILDDILSAGSALAVEGARKEEMISTVASMMNPSKNVHLIIEALNRFSHRTVTVNVIGSTGNPQYLSYLKRMSKGGKAKVNFLVNVSRKELVDTLLKSKVIVHAKKFEPFGIGVAEGMAAGCVPVVWKGTLSGPWIDVILEGKFGFGFHSEKGLAETLENILSNENEYQRWSNLSIRRAKDFSLQSFNRNIEAALSRIA